MIARRTRSVEVVMVTTLLSAATTVHADPTKRQCVEAADRAQTLRHAGKVAAARAEFRTCLAPTCPALVVHDCAQWLEQADKAQPTVVFAAKDLAGSDVSDVRVSVDGKPLASELKGDALDVDPGEHVFVFSTGRATVTRKLIVLEGDKQRRETVVVDASVAVMPPPAVARVEGTPSTHVTVVEASAPSAQPNALASDGGSDWGSRRVAAIVTAGVGAAGLGVGGVFGGLTFGAVSAQHADCPSSTQCASPKAATSDHSTAVTDGAISTVAIIAGGALVAAGAVIYFTAPSRGSSRTALLPTFGPAGTGLSLQGRF